MSTAVIITLLGLIVVVWITMPFFMKNVNSQHLDVDEGEQQKEQIFNQLSDLEYDYHMNKITAEDYETTKTELMTKAAQVMDSGHSDYEQIEKDVDDEIEKYIGRLPHGEKEALHES